jgi:hypothetical protein
MTAALAWEKIQEAQLPPAVARVGLGEAPMWDIDTKSWYLAQRPVGVGASVNTGPATTFYRAPTPQAGRWVSVPRAQVPPGVAAALYAAHVSGTGDKRATVGGVLWTTDGRGGYWYWSTGGANVSAPVPAPATQPNQVPARPVQPTPQGPSIAGPPPRWVQVRNDRVRADVRQSLDALAARNGDFVNWMQPDGYPVRWMERRWGNAGRVFRAYFYNANDMRPLRGGAGYGLNPQLSPVGFGPSPATLTNRPQTRDFSNAIRDENVHCPSGCVAIGTAGARGYGALNPQLAPAGFGSAADDLSAFNATVQAGDMYLAGGQYIDAVNSFKAAGQVGVSTVGPEIDAQTNGASVANTQQAWKLNSDLQSIGGFIVTVADATKASLLAHTMQALYVAAIAMPSAVPPSGPPAPGPSPGPNPGPNPMPPTPVPPSGGATTGPATPTDYTAPILIGAGVLAVGIVGWAWYTRPNRRLAA